MLPDLRLLVAFLFVEFRAPRELQVGLKITQGRRQVIEVVGQKTAVSAGKYLNDRTYVTIEKGEKAGSGKATINLDIGRGVKLKGSAAEDGEAKGGIFYEREY